MADTGIIYFIAAGCAIFGVVTAYLIYNFVQQEKADYYKYQLRKKQMKKNPTNYDYVAPKEKKRKLSGPVVAAAAPEKEPLKPSSRNGAAVPIPAPLLAPVHLPPVPKEIIAAPPPPAAAHPVPPPENVTHSNTSTTVVPAAAAVGGGAAGVGAFAAYQAAKPNPEPEVKKPEPKNNEKKRKGSIKKVPEEDFDDYRNFSPTVLPPPKAAPPPPKANYTPAATEAPPTRQPPPTQQSDDVKSVTFESDRNKRRGMEYPRVAVVNREGLLF